MCISQSLVRLIQTMIGENITSVGIAPLFCSKLISFVFDLYRGKFNQEMLGDEIDVNLRPIFPVELDDELVLEDTKEWVQKG
jgi:hypothetical protein